jgi:probable HAF family extracellular repeat protein
MQDLGTVGGTSSHGVAINDKGQVTGSASTADDPEPHAFLWNGSAMQDLNDLIHPLQPNVTLTGGVAINDRGQILANGFDSNLHQEHAYLLSPAPPGTATTMTEGVSAVWP